VVRHATADLACPTIQPCDTEGMRFSLACVIAVTAGLACAQKLQVDTVPAPA